MRRIYRLIAILAVLVFSTIVAFTPQADAETASEIDHKVDLALEKLYATSPVAKELAKGAKGILVFPNIVKAGLVVGGQYGEGALRVAGRTVGYYNAVAGSFGLQAGAQTFGYAMFLMTDEALDYLEKSEGWEVGVGPTVVIAEEGMAGTLTTSTAKKAIYAVIFGQKGLMAGINLEGSKITKITPEK